MNTRLKGISNELEVLKALANCGWLTTNLLAQWVWCDSSLKTGINKAQQITRRLLLNGEILARVTLAGPKAWILTQRGALRINDSLVQLGFAKGWAHHGYAISTLQHLKQILVVQALIKYRVDGFAAVGKAGIRAGLVSSKYLPLDGVVVNIINGYTMGLLYVSDRSPSTQDRVAKLRSSCTLILIGEPRIVKVLSRVKEN